MPLTDAQLGKHGEEYAYRLLRDRGYSAEFLPTNAPTYDLKVSTPDTTFFVSVKVSRTKQHVRLGQRKSVLGLTEGNYVFAFSPPTGGTIESLDMSPFELFILPAERVRTESLAIHDAYWSERSRDPNIFSVIVKGYDRYGRPTWKNWQQYQAAWQLLPQPHRSVW
jgi:hypothetical protein